MEFTTRPDSLSDGVAAPPADDGPRRSGRIVGGLFIAAMLTYGPGSGIVASILPGPDHLGALAENATTFRWGAVLMLLNSAVVVAIGVLLYPFLSRYSGHVALGYYACRLVEGALLAVGVVGLLSLVAIGDQYVGAGGTTGSQAEMLGALAMQVNEASYQMAMASLGFGSLFFCSLLHRVRLVPRPLALWGVVGYAIFLAGALLELLGVGVGLLLSIPGGLFEVFLGVWLIVKGFAPTTTTAAPDA